MFDLNNHKANQKTIEYAKANKLSVAELKLKHANTYKILNAQNILDLDPQLESEASGVFNVLFRNRELYRVDNSTNTGLTKLFTFPALSPDELAKFWSGLEILLEQNSLKEKDIYFRVVTNSSGEFYQLALPIDKTKWQGQENLIIGNFANKDDADKWARQVLTERSDLDFDSLSYNGKYFVDIFSVRP